MGHYSILAKFKSHEKSESINLNIFYFFLFSTFLFQVRDFFHDSY